MSKLKSGYTTGACAAAAAKAAVLVWSDQVCRFVEVDTPQGNKLTLPIDTAAKLPMGGQAQVIKDAGDDPDITHGVAIIATVEITETPGVELTAGQGVGTVTKPGLAIPVGHPAINPGPRRMITKAVSEQLPEGKGAKVTISIPAGEVLAARTLNPVLGVAGGLSVLGTTGIVEPMSEDAFKNSLAPQISVAQALGHETIVFVPGKIGQDIAVARLGVPKDAVIQTSNFIGFMLEQAVNYKIKKVLLCGHLGKLVKVAGGIFNTHNRMADARMEILAAHLALRGADANVIEKIMDCTTTEAAMPIIQTAGFADIYGQIAAKASARAMRYVFKDLQIGTIIVTLQGQILGMDNYARELGEELGWNIK